MNPTGMYRKVDELGRIVLPAEIRQTLNLQTKDALEILIDEDKIILRKPIERCALCNGAENLTVFGDKKVCAACVDKIKNTL